MKHPDPNGLAISAADSDGLTPRRSSQQDRNPPKSHAPRSESAVFAECRYGRAVRRAAVSISRQRGDHGPCGPQCRPCGPQEGGDPGPAGTSGAGRKDGEEPAGTRPDVRAGALGARHRLSFASRPLGGPRTFVRRRAQRSPVTVRSARPRLVSGARGSLISRGCGTIEAREKPHTPHQPIHVGDNLGRGGRSR